MNTTHEAHEDANDAMKRDGARKAEASSYDSSSLTPR